MPGDLERAGWMAHLRSPSFKNHLKTVQVFVASHHGRESGYCEEVFEDCRPQVIVFSDSEVRYASQAMAGLYGKHACRFPDRPQVAQPCGFLPMGTGVTEGVIRTRNAAG